MTTPQSGQTLKLRAKEYAAAVEAGQWYRREHGHQPEPFQAATRPTDLVKLRNDCGSDRAQGEVLAIDPSLLEVTYRDSLYLSGVEPVARSAIAVLDEPLTADAIGVAHSSGTCVAKVNVTDLAHRFVVVTTGNYVLQSAGDAGESVGYLLAPVTSTGEQPVAIVLQRILSRENVLGIATAAIAARSGVTLGTGQIWLCDVVSGAIAIATVAGQRITLEVVNMSSEIAAYSLCKAAREWRTGKWVVDLVPCEDATDLAPPGVVDVDGTNGDYETGDTVTITVTFAAAVTVTGSPQLALASGTAGAVATYLSGSGSATLTFVYTVVSTDATDDLDCTSTSALALNGGTINSSLGLPVPLTLPAPNAPHSLRQNAAIRLNHVPAVAEVDGTDGNYTTGSTVSITVAFTATVTVTGTPRLLLASGTSGAFAAYSSGSGTTTLTFVYTVQSGDNATDLDYTGTGALTLNGGTIASAGGISANLTLSSPGAAHSLGANAAIMLNPPPAPTITSVTSPQSGEIDPPNTVNIDVHFDQAVTVAITMPPTLALNTGGNATYSSGSGTDTLRFTYSVQNLDNVNPLNYTSTGAINLNSSTIRNASGADADLTLPATSSASSLSGAGITLTPPPSGIVAWTSTLPTFNLQGLAGVVDTLRIEWQSGGSTVDSRDFTAPFADPDGRSPQVTAFSATSVLVSLLSSGSVISSASRGYASGAGQIGSWATRDPSNPATTGTFTVDLS